MDAVEELREPRPGHVGPAAGGRCLDREADLDVGCPERLPGEPGVLPKLARSPVKVVLCSAEIPSGRSTAAGRYGFAGCGIISA